jgi:hypothetical protein
MDIVIFAMTTLIAIITSFYLFGLSRVQYLKQHWAEYRCNPVYMPMAGFVGDSVVSNFTKCTMKGFQDYAGFMMDPLMAEFSIVNETLSEVGTTMNSMRSMMSSTRSGFLGIIGSVFGKIQNLISQFQYIIVRMRTLLSRIVGTMLSFVYIFYSGMETGTSVMNGPIGKTVSFLCFDPNTLVVLKTNKAVLMKNLKVGDVLYTGETVTSMYKVDAKGVHMYNLTGVIVSGNHKVKYRDEFIKVKDHPQATQVQNLFPFLSCFNTDTHRIHLRGIEFLDFIESEMVLPSISSDISIELENGDTVPIEFADIGMKLKSGAYIVGVVNRKDGYQLITSTHSFVAVDRDGSKTVVGDELIHSL